MIADYHVHSTFSDGADTPRALVEEAIARGMQAIGFSDHSYTAFDESYCMKKDAADAYRASIAALKTEFADRIRIFCGMEQDYFASEPASGYDYVIGSVHYIQTGARFTPVDEGAQQLIDEAALDYGGDIYALIEVYFRTAADVIRKTNADLIGHFDLIAKYNEQTPFFDEHHPRYIRAWQAAADRLLLTGKPFEINMGAVARGCRSVPYPSPEIMDYLLARGASFVLSSDCHKKENLMFHFDRYQALASAFLF